jgi:hypothetical protein
MIAFPANVRRNGSDAWKRRQAAADQIVLNHVRHHAGHSFVTIKDRSSHVPHRFDHGGEHVIGVLDQHSDPRIETSAADRSNQQSAGSQRAPNMIFNVDQFAFQKLAVGPKPAHLLHLDVLHGGQRRTSPAASSAQCRARRYDRSCCAWSTATPACARACEIFGWSIKPPAKPSPARPERGTFHRPNAPNPPRVSAQRFAPVLPGELRQTP